MKEHWKKHAGHALVVIATFIMAAVLAMAGITIFLLLYTR